MSQNLFPLLVSSRPRAASLHGFSLFEFVVVICLIGILLVVAMTRLLPYIVEAERVAVLTLEGQIRNTLVMAAARRIATGEPATIAALNGSNPMDLMLEVPDTYIGELGPEEASPDSSGCWYFDAARKLLVYRPRQGFTFRSDPDPVEQLEFEVRVAFADRNANNVFEPGTDEMYGVRLLRVAGAEWLD